MTRSGRKPAVSGASEAEELRTRPGGRAAKVVAAIRQATFELLAERGYDAIEIPEIAARAGVNRTTVYRRWPSKSELMLEIMLGEMRAKVPAPDTGSFQGDLEALLKSIAGVLIDPVVRSLFHILAAKPDTDAEKVRMRAAFWEERFAVSGEIVSRAIARGQLPEGVSARAVLELGAAPLYYRILALGEPVDDAAIAEMAAWIARQDLKSFPATAMSRS